MQYGRQCYISVADASCSHSVIAPDVISIAGRFLFCAYSTTKSARLQAHRARIARVCIALVSSRAPCRSADAVLQSSRERYAAQGALAKLDNVLPEEQRHEIAWARRTLVTTGMRRAHLDTLTPVLGKLRRAIREQRWVLMVHRKQSNPDAQAREVEPYALVYRAGWWYVVGHCRLRDALRSFRLDRIVMLTLLDKTYQPPADFNIQEFLAQWFASETKVQIRLRFASHAAHVVRDSGVAWDAVEDQADGAVIVTLTLPDLQSAASLALGFGPIVTVLEPEELRQTVRQWAGAIVPQYAPVE